MLQFICCNCEAGTYFLFVYGFSYDAAISIKVGKQWLWYPHSNGNMLLAWNKDTEIAAARVNVSVYTSNFVQKIIILI